MCKPTELLLNLLQSRARSCTVAKQNADNWTCKHYPTTVKDDKFSNATMVSRTSLLPSMVKFFSDLLLQNTG